MVRNIRDISPKPREIDPAWVAKQLGTEIVGPSNRSSGIVGLLASRELVMKQIQKDNKDKPQK